MPISWNKLMLCDKTDYGFSLNGDEQYGNSPSDERFVLTYTHCLDQISKFINVLPDITLYPEYSPAKTTGVSKGMCPRLHFHGRVTVDSFRFYTYGYKKIDLHYTYAFSENVDIEYCQKNKKLMKQWCDKYKLPYEITYSNIHKAKSVLSTWRLRRLELMKRK